MKVLLKKVDLYTPSHIGFSDLLIEDGYIIKIDKDLSCNDCQEINCDGNIACPMFVDGHEHLLGNYWSEEGILSSGVGTIVGCLAGEQSADSVNTLIRISDGINARKKIDAFCLAGSKNFTLDTFPYILNHTNVIGIKTALFQPQRPKPNLSYEKLKDDALITYKAGLKSGRLVQVHIHLDHPFSNGEMVTLDEINSGKLDNLSWIDRIVEETGVPYSLFKLTHAQKYYSRILEYANKGCFIDYTAFSGDYDSRFDCLVEAIRNKTVDLTKVSISSDLGIMTMEKGVTGEEIPISLLNTLRKLVLEKGLRIKDVIPLITINPASLINQTCGRIKEGDPCKIVLLDNDLNIQSIFNYNEIFAIEDMSEEFKN